MSKMSNIGQRIMRLRNLKGWSQQELADKLNATVAGAKFNNGLISKYESGSIKISVELIVPLCDLLGATPDYLFDYKSESLVPQLIAELAQIKEDYRRKKKFYDQIMKVAQDDQGQDPA